MTVTGSILLPEIASQRSAAILGSVRILLITLALQLAALAEPPTFRLSDLQLLATIPIEAPLDHVQGIDVEGDTLWISSVDRKAKRGLLTRVALPTGKMLQQVEVSDGARYHPGGIMLDGDSVWVPVAEYRRSSSSVVQKRNKRTLQIEASFPVSDHIGAVAVRGREVIGANWDARVLYRWAHNGNEIGRQQNPKSLTYQDLKVVEGVLVGSGMASRSEGVIAWLSEDLEVVRQVLTGVTDRGVVYTHEGMAIREGRLYLLPEDEPARLFVFAWPQK